MPEFSLTIFFIVVAVGLGFVFFDPSDWGKFK